MPKQQDDFRDIAAQRGVLAGICQYGGDAFIDVDDILDANAFPADHLDSVIYKSLQLHFNNGLDKPVDVPSIISSARALGLDAELSTPHGMRHLRALFNYPIAKATVRREAEKIFKLNLVEDFDCILAQQRRDIRTITGHEPFSEIMAMLENPVFDFTSRLNRTGTDGPQHITTGIDEWLDSLEANPRDNIGISSGYGRYDWYIGGGFRRATVSVLGARMKVGKTIFCDNIALHVAGNLGIPVLNLDTEMTQMEHLARILSHVAGTRSKVLVGIREIEKGIYARDDTKRRAVRDAAAWLKTVPYEYESVIEKSFEEQVATIRRWTIRNVGVDETGRTKDCLVIYDYLQPPEPGEFNETYKEYQLLGYQMLSLLRMASKCDIPIFTLVQLNRDGIDRESTSVAADSDRVLRKGANFTILKEKNEEEIAEDGPEEGNLKLVPIIARHGEKMAKKDYINIRFEGSTAKMVEGRTRNEIAQAKKATGPKKGFEVEVPDSESPDDTQKEIEF